MQIDSTGAARARGWNFLAVIYAVPIIQCIMFLPFLPGIAFGALMAVIFSPFVVYLKSKTGWSQKWASVLVVVMILAGLVLPTGVATWKIVGFSGDTVEKFDTSKLQRHLAESLKDISIQYPQTETVLEKAIEFVKNPQALIMGSAGIVKTMKNTSGKIAIFAKDTVSSIIFALIQFFIGLVVMYHFLSTGEEQVCKIRLHMPIDPKSKDNVLKQLMDIVRNVAYGMFLNGVWQGGAGILVVLGYLIFFNPLNLMYYILIVISFFVFSCLSAPISGAGVAICAVTEFAQGNMLGAGILGVCVFVVMSSDNIPKKIVGDKTGFGFVYITLAMICGYGLFGFIGVFLGPLVIKSNRLIWDGYHKYLENYDKDDQSTSLNDDFKGDLSSKDIMDSFVNPTLLKK